LNTNMNIKNIVAGGCSFTQDGISGIPPFNEIDGGNSFLDYPEDNIVASVPKSWAGMISQHLGAKSMVNVAASGHGNLLTANSLLNVLTRFNYPKEQTLVLFNITEPTRLDVPCEFSHQNKCTDIPWDSTILPLTYLSNSCPTVKTLKKHIGPDAISYLTSNSIKFLLNFLKSNQYTFLFLTMCDYTNDQYLAPILHDFQNNYVILDQFNNMMDFCVYHHATVSDKDHHPNVIGHQMIAERVLQRLNNLRVE
jgi:hypothetical protein